MHCDICILAPQGALSRLFLLECEDCGKRAVHTDDPEALVPADLYIIDADRFSCLPDEGNVLRYGTLLSPHTSRRGGGILTEWHRPFLLAELRRFLLAGGEADDGLLLLPKERAVRLGGEYISLSPHEYACLSCLWEANGAPVSREELYAAAWGEGPFRAELVNVYLHYLRKKLERGGRRMIVSVRGHGYALRREGTL